jgi:hypothetical protein
MPKTNINPVALLISLQQVLQMSLNKFLPSAVLTSNQLNGNGKKAEFVIAIHGLKCRITMEVLSDEQEQD